MNYYDKTNRDVLKEMEFNLQNNSSNNTLNNMEKVIAEIMSFHAKAVEKVENHGLKKSVTEKGALAGVTTRFSGDYLSISQKLNKLIIGQNLMKNQNLFNEEMIIKIQEDADQRKKN